MQSPELLAALDALTTAINDHSAALDRNTAAINAQNRDEETFETMRDDEGD
jgi:hypothetical protein